MGAATLHSREGAEREIHGGGNAEEGASEKLAVVCSG